MAVLAIIVAGAAMIIVKAAGERRASIVQRFNSQHIEATEFLGAYVRQIETHELNLAKLGLSGDLSAGSLGQTATLNLLQQAAVYDGDGTLLVHYPARRELAISADERANLDSALGAIASVAAVGDPGDRAASTVSFAVPYDTPSGPRIFTGRYSSDDTLLRPFVANALNSYRSGRVYLITSSSHVIVADRRDDAGQELGAVAPGLAPALSSRREGFFDGRSTYFVSRPVSGTTWRLVFTLSSDELFETVTPEQAFVPWIILAGSSLMGLGLIRMFIQALTGRARADDARARQEAILEAAGDTFIGLDDAGRVTDWNSAATRLLGRSRSETLGRPILSLGIVPGSAELNWTDFQHFLRTQSSNSQRSQTFHVQHRDGRLIPIELAVAVTPWAGTWRLHAFIRDMTERLEHEKQLHELALTDPLTGLANRRAFLEQLDRAYARHQRHRTSFAVLYADVDHFKRINDDLGHAAGDAVLLQVSARLREHFRTDDTVGRLGGDEFAVIFESTADDADTITSRLRGVLTRPYDHQGRTIEVTVSIGLAVPAPDEDAVHLLERADHLMYTAKRARSS